MKPKKYPDDVSAEVFGAQMLSILHSYGFGTLGKADLEAALLHAMMQASQSLKAADSYDRAEMLHITDQKLRTLSRRGGMWLNDASNKQSDHELFSEFLTRAIELYMSSPDEKEVRVVIDDEMKRRNMQRALERASISGLSIAVEISLTGRSLVLRGSDLDRMIDRLKSDSKIDQGLKDIINQKQGLERRKNIFEFLKKAGSKVTESLVAVLLPQLYVL